MAILKDFKEFALKGSVIDLAVGVVIGAAFTALIESHSVKRQSDEAAEGFAAFREKRPARYNAARKTKG